MSYAAYAEKLKNSDAEKTKDSKEDNYEEEYRNIVKDRKGTLNKDRFEEYKESKKYLDSVKDKLTKEEYEGFLNGLKDDAAKGEELKLVRGYRHGGKYKKVPYQKRKYNFGKEKIQNYVDNLENERKQREEAKVREKVHEERRKQEEKTYRNRLLSLVKDGKYTDNPLNRALGIVGKKDNGIYYDLDIPNENGKGKREPYYLNRFYDSDDFIKKLAKEINPNLNEKSSKFNVKDNLAQFKKVYDDMLSSYFFSGTCPYTRKDLEMSLVGHNSPKWKEWNSEYRKRK